MSTSSKAESYLHFRAPRRHGEILCTASTEELSAGIAKNSRSLDCSHVSIHGTALRDVRRQTRQEIGSLFHVDPSQPWIVGGHQPELFHPGVWLKNFALHQMAKQHSAIALNLVVDHDVCNHVSIRVPSRAADGALEIETIPWDSSASGVPWERQFLKDAKLFDSFASRLNSTLSRFGFTPLIDSMWGHALHLRDAGHSVGHIFATLRHSLETKHGVHNREFFSRQLVQSTGFRLLLLHLVTHRERFRDLHNLALQHYREAHRIRSTSHPVPDLRKINTEIEIPMWVHTSEDPRRRAVFAGANGNQIYLTDQKTTLCSWARHDSAELILHRLANLDAAGIFLRPRALLTTMSLRMLLADWFVHGIGGGKYDQLNDRIMASFFDFQPPEFSVISGTLYFPFEDAQQSLVSDRTISRDPCFQNYMLFQTAKTTWLDARQLERKHRYHPEKTLPLSSPDERELLAQKMNLLKARPVEGSRKQWHQDVERVRNQLVQRVRFSHNEYSAKIAAAWHELQQAQLRISREFSFAVYPESWLVSRLQAQAEQCCQMEAKTTVHTSPQTSPT